MADLAIITGLCVRAQAQAKGLAWAVDRATAGKGALLTAAGLYAALAMAAGSADLANGQEVFDGNCACGPAHIRSFPHGRHHLQQIVCVLHCCCQEHAFDSSWRPLACIPLLKRAEQVPPHIHMS